MPITGNEILTLQFGHYSNFIGAHWWNCQEASFNYVSGQQTEINHDVLFREGQTTRGEVTFTPRLLLVDLKGTLGTLPEEGRLYNLAIAADPSLPLWPTDKVCIQSQGTASNNEFLQDMQLAETLADSLPEGLKEKGQAVPKLYQMESSVSSWSDYIRPHLHPRSVNIVQDFHHNSSSHPFHSFPQGQAVWTSPRFHDEFTDKIRLYLEETDNLQGFQIVMDNFDGFSGLGCAGMQYLRDEYASKPSLCLACQPPQPPQASVKADSLRVLNQALALASLSESCSLFVPVSGATQAWRQLGPAVSLPHVTYRADLPYHTSAVVASALDTVSLLYRLRSSIDRLSDLTLRLAQGGRVAGALSVRLPLSLSPTGTLLGALESWEGPLTQSLTPLPLLPSESPSGPSMQSLVLRGLPESKLMRPGQFDPGSQNPAYSCQSLSQLLKTYLLFDGQTTAQSQVMTADSPLITSAPYPQIFDRNFTPEGQLDSSPRPAHLGVEQVPVMAGLHSSLGLGPLLDTLHREAKQINVKTLHQFADAGLESVELGESLEQLLCLSECYSPNDSQF